MKRFNILTQPTYYAHRHLPIGSVMGKYKCKYTYWDRRTEQYDWKIRTVIYVCRDFKPTHRHCINPRGEIKFYSNNYNIDIYNEEEDKWYTTTTDCKSLHPLAVYLDKMFIKCNILPDDKVQYYTTKKEYSNLAHSELRERSPQRDYEPITGSLHSHTTTEYSMIPAWEDGNERRNYNKFSSGITQKFHKK